MKAVRFYLKVYYGQLRRGRIPGRQKSSPLVPLGLHSLFACLRTIHPAVVFFCHTFCSTPFPRGLGVAKKKSGTPTATTVPEMRQKKNNSKLYIHNA